MGKLQLELLAAAQTVTTEHLLHHPIFAPCRDDLTILLAGSGAAAYADRYSGVDLVVLGDEAAVAGMRQRLADAGLRTDRDGFIVLPGGSMAGDSRLMFMLHTYSEVTSELANYEDFAMLTYPQAPVIYDPQQRFPELVAAVGPYPDEILAERLRERYRRLRRRRASIAWNLRRGQPFVLLQNLVAFLDHVFSMCFLLAGQPPAGRKWLMQEGLRTPAGRQLRPILFDLFTNLGDVALLGGTLDIRQNRLYDKVSRLQELLEAAATAAGWDLTDEGPQRRAGIADT